MKFCTQSSLILRNIILKHIDSDDAVAKLLGSRVLRRAPSHISLGPRLSRTTPFLRGVCIRRFH